MGTRSRYVYIHIDESQKMLDDSKLVNEEVQKHRSHDTNDPQMGSAGAANEDISACDMYSLYGRTSVQKCIR